MRFSLRLGAFISPALILGIATGTFAQSYPAKPIRILTSQAASGNEISTRTALYSLSVGWIQGLPHHTNDAA
jgi:hypothetical protein